MKNNLKDYIETLRRTSLSMSDKERMRNELLAYTHEHPNALESNTQSPLRDTLYALRGLFTRPLALVSAISLFLVISGSTSFAAEKAVPGSALYSIKIHVNEPLRSALALTPEAKAAWSVDRVERRLQEAEQLSASNTLNAHDVTTLNELLKNQAQQVAVDAASLSKKDNNAGSAKILSSLESKLKAHSEILLQMGASNNSDVKRNVSRILDNTITVAQETEDLRSHAEDSLSTQNISEAQKQAKKKIQAAQNALTATQKRLASSRLLLGASTVTRVELSLTAAKDALTNANNKQEEGLSNEAFASAQQGHRLALEASAIIDSMKRLNKKKLPANQHGQDDTTASFSSSNTASTTTQFRQDEERGGRLQQLRSGNKKLWSPGKPTSSDDTFINHEEDQSEHKNRSQPHASSTTEVNLDL